MNIDGENAVLGRLATKVVKELMKGEKVNIYNAEKIIITGNPSATVEKYMERRQRGSAHHGPYFPKTTEGIVRRAVRGMIPYKTHKGRAAFKNLRVYISMPSGVSGVVAIGEEITAKHMAVGELAKTLGCRK